MLPPLLQIPPLRKLKYATFEDCRGRSYHVPALCRGRGLTLTLQTGLGKLVLSWIVLKGFILLSLRSLRRISCKCLSRQVSHRGYREPATTQPHVRVGTSCLGPKSKGVRRDQTASTKPFSLGRFVLLFVILTGQFSSVTGVRVAASPMGAAEAAQQNHRIDQGSAAKPHGYPLTVSGAPHTRAGKRSYRRACARAQRSQQGGTWYKGRWLTANALRATPSSRTQPVSKHQRRCAATRSVQASAVSRAGSKQSISVFTWNCGGLSTGLMDEIFLYLQERAPHVNVVCLQETHWKHDSEWLTEKWICVHSHDPKHTYAGVLTLISRKLVSSEDIRTVAHVPGRILQVRFPVAGVHADVLSCYQIPWTTRGSTQQQLLDKRAKFWNALEAHCELTCISPQFAPCKSISCEAVRFSLQAPIRLPEMPAK